MSDRIIIASAARTPMGAFQGELASLTAPQLGATAIRAAVERAGLKPEQIEEVIMGCVLPAGQGQAPARQAALGAGLPLSVGCTTVNKMCGSGMRAAMNAYDALLAGSVDVVVAGGMESMTNAPYLIPKGRGGYRIGHGMIYDHMMLDGLEDAYDKGRAMGTFGEDCAEKYGFTREAQDAFAMASVRRAQEATESGAFRWEIAPVTVSGKAGDTVVDTDEGPRRIKVDKIPSLKPAFKKDGTVTAASSSSINDGAAALVMMRESTAKQLGIAPLAVMLGHTTHAQAPGWFTTAPVTAIDKLFKKLGWNAANVDLFEINEAFAVVPMAAMHDLHIPHEKVNVNGGACALGHPIGASGARLIATLLGALRHRGGKRGVASLCIGGGEATAVGIELL
ncbi:acetyl-CoA C-acetyltransferase [Ralstonia solanacearum]|uniref:Acetyl-CoA acetyltransferase n=1 Tax=Ralstonia solanacearum K60 TaxID=1091042 RepID=A0AAP7ZMI9_RALSL|nr:acetyl-CoA C-acetyltransferase [Ralstonia solanacearum]MBT1536930.1 acetyl-CoA C-acetyltransferase [Ralstonia solanacearum]OYQ13079.1 acetyl-CoA acetyltransferase [Ralstonia solanacearum K60]QOK83433.1 acetyl-CoA C-acetyltransferase [Ralstonia solanacearum]RIJ87132.1 acetyl-CoA C-acyltransferase [Ralstonia solanacearum]CCF97454.1 putative acetyl-CoA acetyltransferase with thiolase domain [Ralstonia solanacearum K60]